MGGRSDAGGPRKQSEPAQRPEQRHARDGAARMRVGARLPRCGPPHEGKWPSLGQRQASPDTAARGRHAPANADSRALQRIITGRWVLHPVVVTPGKAPKRVGGAHAICHQRRSRVPGSSFRCTGALRWVRRGAGPRAVPRGVHAPEQGRAAGKAMWGGRAGPERKLTLPKGLRL